MKLAARKDQIIEGLQKAAGILPNKTGAAYLRSVWLKAENGSLDIMATDANLEFIGSYPVDVESEGLVGVPGKAFVELARRLPDGELRLSLDKNGSALTLKAGRCSYKLPVSGPEWFQEIDSFPTEEPVTWTGDVFMEILDKIPFCIDDDDAREATACICFKPMPDGRIDICGLNGHQFALVSYTQPDLCAKLGDSALLIQKKYLPDIRKWLDPNEIEINLSSKKLYLRSKDGAELLSVNRVNYAYPDYNLFMSKLDDPGVSRLELSRKEAMDAFDRLAIFSTESERFVSMELWPGEARLTAEGADVGSAREELEVSYSGDLKRIAFPTRNLLEIFGHFNSERMEMLFTGPEGPCGIRGLDPVDKDYLVIIMPMKVSEKNYYVEEDE